MPALSLSFKWILCPILVASIARIGSADEPKQVALTAMQILDRMAKTYADCKSYSDSGLVKTVFIDADGNRTVEKPFNTAFVRPDRFRFEYHEKAGDERKNRYLVWRNGKEVQTWWDIKPEVAKPESLSLALAGATGVSSGSAHTVPALLLPEEIGGRKLTEMTEAKKLEDARLDKADCFRIQGLYVAKPMTLWIDKKTFLVRRMDTENKFDNFRTESTTTYDPVLDGKIADKMLEFDPPKQK